jgi:long-chain fatty acid transport protein
MTQQQSTRHYKTLSTLLCMGFWIFTRPLYASFIEATMGTAVVNDATATYHNPAALTLLKNPQVIALGSAAYFHSTFTGQTIQAASGFTQAGPSKANSEYYIPSMYIGLPATSKLRFGLAILSNMLNSNTDENSILRYAQTRSHIDNIDVMPGVGWQLNDYVSIGGGLTYSHAKFILNPIIGFPSLNIPDSQSHNVATGSSYGANAGFLIKPTQSTLIGFNYRSALSYQFNGTSALDGLPAITSNHYNFNFWTPARTILTISHFFSQSFGLISTAQRVQWSIFKSGTVHGIATRIGEQPVILPKAMVPYHLRDAWVYTFGGIQKIASKWVIRIAGSYIQSPSQGRYQISNGDNYIAGASIGYDIYKNLKIDVGYAHAFIKDQPIHIASRANIITGKNTGARDAVSLKLTINI